MSFARVALPLTLWSVALAGCRSAGAPGAAEPRLPSTMGGTQTRADGRLANGVRVIVEENHAAPVVAIQVWVSGGAGADPAGLEGTAHFFEHLLFRGTARRAPGAAAREIEALGGMLGAWTGPDESVLHAAVAAPYLELGLDVLGDAVTSPRFDPAEIERARRTILSELAVGQGDAARVGGQALMAAAFPGESASRPLLGTTATVAARTREQLVARFAQAYVGGALTVVIVGDVDAGAARAAAGRAFAGVRPGPAPDPVRGDVAAGVSHGVALARFSARPGRSADPLSAELLLGFRSRTPSPEDAAALDVLAALLAGGGSGRLDRELVRNGALAERARAFSFCSRSVALLALGLQAPPRRMDAVATAALEVARGLAREEVSSDELARARVAVAADVARGEAGVEGRARHLGFAATVVRELDWSERYRTRLERLTPADLRGAAAELLAGAPPAIAVAVPEASGLADADLRARLEPLATTAAHPAAVMAAAVPLAGGDVVRFVAPSGLRIVALRDPAARMVTVEAAWAGTAEPDVSGGATAALVAALLGHGTRTKSAADIAAELRALGGGVEGFAAPGMVGIRAEMLSSGVDRGLAIVADCLLHPSFPEDELERERRALVERLRQSRDRGPAMEAALRLFRETLGPEHPRWPDPEAVSSIGRVRLTDRYRRLYPPGQLVVAIIGDISPSGVMAIAAALLGGDKPGAGAPARLTASPRPVPPPLPAVSGGAPNPPTTVFRRSARPDAEAVVGYPTFAPGDPDRLALELLAEILGGEGGRLAHLFSDANAQAFQASARAAPPVEPGYLALALSCTPNRLDAAVAAARDALASVLASGVTADEVSRAARRLVGARAAALRSHTAIAHALVVDEARGLPPLAYRQEAIVLAHLRPDDVARAARRAFDPAREVIAVVTGAGK